MLLTGVRLVATVKSMMHKEKTATALGEIASISAGHPIRGRIEYDPQGSHLVVQIKDVDPVTGIDLSGLVRFSPKGRKEPILLGTEDLLFVGRGNRLFGVQVVRHLENAVAAPHFFVIKINTPAVMPSYLAWFINHTRAQQYFWQHAAGSTIPHVNRKVIEDLPVLIPQLNKQATIVKAHGCWLREKRVMAQIEQKREQMITAILDDALED